MSETIQDTKTKEDEGGGQPVDKDGKRSEDGKSSAEEKEGGDSEKEEDKK